MPRGLTLTAEERGRIIAYNEVGWSQRKIATKIMRSKTVIHNFLANPTTYGVNNGRKMKRKVSKTAERRLIRAASNKVISASQLQQSLDLKISVRRVQQLLHSSPYMRYMKMRKGPWLSKSHMERRVEWASEHVHWTSHWSRVIFSDEKKFNLDGPDGFNYYWHDLRKEKRIFSTRSHGGGSVMIWAAIFEGGRSELAILDGNQTADNYVTTLSKFLLPCLSENSWNEYSFQQDGAAIHTAFLTRHFLLMKNIRVIDWPSHSPDLNPIENVWSLLARKVYANERTFQSKDELREAIVQAWHELEISAINKLINSMQKRCISVILNKGRCIT